MNVAPIEAEQESLHLRPRQHTPLAQRRSWVGTLQNNRWDQYTGDQLIVLAPNEGLVIVNLTAMGAAGIVRLYANIEFAIASAF